MDKFVTKRNDLLAEQVIKNLKSRQMEGHYVQTKEEALALGTEADSGRKQHQLGRVYEH